MDGGTVGVIGLGRMGRPMAERLLAAGCALVVRDRNWPKMGALARQGAQETGSPGAVALAARTVLLSLPDDEAVAGAVAAMLPYLGPGHLVLDTSTVSPDTSRALAARVAATGAAWLECPVCGGVSGARQGTLVVLAGGEAADLERARPILAHLARAVVHCGPAGAGSAAKLCDNLLAACNLAAACEGLLLGARAGVEAAVLHQAVLRSTGRSAAWEGPVPERVLAGRFEAGFPVVMMTKDLGLARALARRLGVRLLLGGQAEQVFLEAEAAGHGADDCAALVRPLERIAGAAARGAVDADAVTLWERQGPPAPGPTPVGVVGLGNLGGPVAGRFARGGWPLTVCDLRPEAVAALTALGARAAPTPAALAGEARVILLALPDAAAVEAALGGPAGLLARLGPGHLVLDLSTVGPGFSRRQARRAADQGAVYLDTPVSGGVAGARAGTLTVMAGGDREALAGALPVLFTFGARVCHCGGAGAGSTVKLANNLLLAANLAACAEVLTLGEAAGLDPAVLHQALMLGSGKNQSWAGRVPQRMLRGDFSPAFSLDLMAKDLRLALDLAHHVGLRALMGSQALQLYEEARALGLGGQDVAAVVQAVRRAAGR